MKPIRFAVLLALCAVPSAPAGAQTLAEQIRAAMPALMALYRDLHAHPELSTKEVRTSALLAGRMRKLGFEVTDRVGGTGVVAVLRNGDGPTLMLRTDMDGLPVVEQTGLPFASQERAVAESGVEMGVMHACGHDTHMAAWVGAAQLLAARKAEWRGTLLMIAQPAEETGEGAAAMLADGLFKRFPKPDYALAFHNAAQLPAGQVGFTPGYALANVDSVDLVVRGVGGHGAYPQATRDPIVLASAIVTRLQTLVSRESNPLDASVITVGSFHAGAKHNIIPDEARLQLTVRSYTDAQRELLLDGIARVARGEAIAAGVPDDRMPLLTVKQPYTPSTFNTPGFSERVAGLLRARFGDKRVVQVPPTMAGEDFGQFQRAAPESLQSMIFWVGGVPEKAWHEAQEKHTPLPSLHSPLWAPDADAVISTAVEALAGTAIDLLTPAGPS